MGFYILCCDINWDIFPPIQCFCWNTIIPVWYLASFIFWFKQSPDILFLKTSTYSQPAWTDHIWKYSHQSIVLRPAHSVMLVLKYNSSAHQQVLASVSGFVLQPSCPSIAVGVLQNPCKRKNSVQISSSHCHPEPLPVSRSAEVEGSFSTLPIASSQD